MNWFDSFELLRVDLPDSYATLRFGGNRHGPALVLLHGFPQTHVRWHRVAQQLVNDYFLIMPDLRGYGDSSHDPGLPDHSNYSKRSLAADVVSVANALGIVSATGSACVRRTERRLSRTSFTVEALHARACIAFAELACRIS